MITLLILAVMVGTSYLMLYSGQSTWFTTDTQIQLQDGLRQILEKVSMELSESGSDKNGVMQVTIGNGTGVNGTDIVTFAIPVVCHNGDNILDANGDVAYWGASLNWGCTSPSCMDVDDDCATVDYKSIQYLLTASNQLIRRVLDSANGVVRSDIFAQDISDFQATISVDNNVMTLNVTAQKKNEMNKTISFAHSISVYLRNRG